MCYGMGCPFEDDLGECKCGVEQQCYMEKIKKEKQEERVYQEFVEIILEQKNTFYCPYCNSSYLEFNKEDNLFTCEHCGQIYDLEDLTKAYYEELSKLSEKREGVEADIDTVDYLLRKLHLKSA